MTSKTDNAVVSLLTAALEKLKQENKKEKTISRNILDVESRLNSMEKCVDTILSLITEEAAESNKGSSSSSSESDNESSGVVNNGLFRSDIISVTTCPGLHKKNI